MFENITSLIAMGGLAITVFAVYHSITKAVKESQQAFEAFKSCQEVISLALADKNIDNSEIEQIIKVLAETNKEGREAIDSWAAAKVEVMGLISKVKKKFNKEGNMK